jgi:hypothetical protein
MKSRVAAYVREPHASALTESDEAKEQAIAEARPFLERQGWSELEFRGAEWDDDPQSGSAFYIHFQGVAPGGRPSAFTELSGAVDCIEFSPGE